MHDLVSHCEEFSKSLMVTIFAIFAFTSGQLLETEISAVKWFYSIALLLSVCSLCMGYKTILVRINYLSTSEEPVKKENVLPKHIVDDVISNLKLQFYFSVISLLFLATCVFVYFVY